MAGIRASCLLLLLGAGCTSTRPPPAPDLSVCALPLPDRLGTSAAVERDLDEVRASGVLRVAFPDDGRAVALDAGRVVGFEHDVVAAFARTLGVRVEAYVLEPAAARDAGLADGRFDVVVASSSDADARAHVVDTVPLVLVQGATASCAPEAPVPGLDPALGAVIAADGVGEVLADAPVALVTRAAPDGVPLDELVVGAVDGLDALVLRVDQAQALPPGATTVPLGAAVARRVATHAGAVGLGDALARFLGGAEDRIALARQREASRAARGPRPWISAHDDVFRAEAQRTGLPWTLLAAVAWQESRFRADAVSPAGAQGLMQVMPATAELLALDDPFDAPASVRAGARYLAMLDRRWAARVPDPYERLAFVLASYNAGAGHVDDAVVLADRDGDRIDRWRSVERHLARLTDPAVYRGPGIRHGYCRATEPIAYVRSVLARWRLYEALLGEGGPDASPLG